MSVCDGSDECVSGGNEANGWEFATITTPLASLSGTLSELDEAETVLTASGSDLTIQFTSDYSEGGDGFEGAYSCAPDGSTGRCCLTLLCTAALYSIAWRCAP